MKNTIALYLIAVGVGIIALQNAGIVPPLKTAVTRIDSAVPITARIDGTVPVTGSVNIANTVDANLSEIVGRQLVESQRGMYIGVNSISNTVIPIHWGEMSVNVDNAVDIRGSVDVDNTVSVQGAVDVDNIVDVDVGNEVRLSEPVEVSVVR